MPSTGQVISTQLWYVLGTMLLQLLQRTGETACQALVPCRKAFKGRNIQWALDDMVASDKRARDDEAENRNCCQAFVTCGSILDCFKCWDSGFGFKETAQELDMLLAGTP